MRCCAECRCDKGGFDSGGQIIPEVFLHDQGQGQQARRGHFYDAIEPALLTDCRIRRAEIITGSNQKDPFCRHCKFAPKSN